MESKPSPLLKFLLVTVAAAVVVLVAFSGFRLDESETSQGSGVANADDSRGATRIGAIDTSDRAKISGRLSRPFVSRDHRTTITKVGDLASSHTRQANADDESSEPLYQEKYLAALIAMMEKDGKDNALIHYALAFEMAPENPTPEQIRLIQQVLDEGWDERADALLPYLAQWQAAFAEIQKGAALDYARGIGTEMGASTPVPNFLKAQNAAKMLAVYSRYLESQGKSTQAIDQLAIAMSMGRDFNSPDNLMISSLIGTAIQNIGLKQIAALSDSGAFNDHNNMSSLFAQYENGQATMQQIIDTEIQVSLNSIKKSLTDPEYRNELTDLTDQRLSDEQLKQLQESYNKMWKEQSEYFSKPYWEREKLDFDDTLASQLIPNFQDTEIRQLATTSRLRQQQIDFAIQEYMRDNSSPPPSIATLVSNGYLSKAPIDPFSGKSFTYNVTGNTYDLYGSGPNIKTPYDPGINWSPVNGNLSDGVIRLKGF